MISYVPGDATQPIASSNALICHVVNDAGGWGRGFVLAVSRRWPEPEAAYRKWARAGLTLGMVQTVPVNRARAIVVVNMCAQHGYQSIANPVPLRYDALATCLEKVARYREARMPSASVHMPRIGCGLAGGSWPEVERMIESNLHGVPVYIYDLRKGGV